MIEEENLKNYLSNTSWLALEKTFRTGVGFLVGIYIARFLGPENFGLLSYALSFIAFFSAFSTLGLDGILIRELVNETQRKEVLLGTAIGLKFLGALVALLLIFVSTSCVPHDHLTQSLILITAFTFLFQSFNVIDLFFQSKILSKYVVFAQLVQMVISAVFKLILVFLNVPLVWFGFAIVLDSIVLAVGLCVVYSRNYSLRRMVHFEYKLAQQLLKSSFPLMLSGIAISIYMRIDQVIIKTFLDNKALGCYAAAITICEALYPISLVIIGTFFPVILNNKKTDRELYYKNLQKLYDIMVLLAFFVSLLVTLTADKIILRLFGAQYAAAIPALKIYIWVSVFVFLGAANERWLWAENLQKYAFYRTLTGCLLSVGLNLVLIPWLNIKGAAISALIAFGFVSYASFALFKPMRSHFMIVSRSLNIYSGLKRILYFKES